MAIVGAMTIFTAAYFWTQQNILLSHGIEMEEHVASAAAFLSSRTELLNQAPTVLVNDQLLKNVLASTTPGMDELNALNLQLEKVNTQINALAIYVMDPAGTAIASSNWRSKTSLIGKNFAFRPYFQNAMALGSGLYVALGVITNKMGIYVSRVVKRGEETLGVVTVKYPLVLLEHQPIETNNESIFAVVDANGIIFDTSSRALLLQALAPLSQRTQDTVRRNKQYGSAPLLPLKIVDRKPLGSGELISLPAPPVETKSQKNIQFIYQSRPVLGTDWTVVGLNRAEFTYDEIAWNMIVAFLAYLIAFTTFILLRQRKLFLEAVYDNAIRDPLTGLFTRLYAKEEVPRLIRSHDERGVSNIAAIFFDIDHFKKVNDTYGHAVGDSVLRDIGQLLLAETRSNDITIRLGGEELAIVMPTAELQIAIEVAERMRRKIENQTFGGETKFSVTVSGGVVLRQHGEEMDAFFERGDQLLYQAKEMGRNQIVSNGT